MLFRVQSARYYQAIEEHYGRTRDTTPASGAVPRSRVATENVELCREPMLNLIGRYDLCAKSVLSIGSGDGHEEYWFWRNRCRLTFVDNNPRFEEYLAGLPLSKNAEDAIDFHLSDADDFLKETPENTFDAVYVSSFHPDEIRREQIQEAFRLVRSAEDTANYITWPPDELPYLHTLIDAIHTVKPGGLVIFQHYRGGVDITYNLHYLPLVRKQLESRGAELLEVYYFAKSPAIQLIVGMKAGQTTAREFLRSNQENPEIRTFHGRYPYADYKQDVSKAFDLLREQQEPAGN